MRGFSMKTLTVLVCLFVIAPAVKAWIAPV